MHQLVFGINFLINSESVTSLVLIHLLIHLSTHLSHHPCSQHPSQLHSFTPGSKPTFLTNPFHLRLLYLLDCLMIKGLDRTYHAHDFIFNFTFCYSVWQTKLATRQQYTLSYHIVLYAIWQNTAVSRFNVLIHKIYLPDGLPANHMVGIGMNHKINNISN